MEAEFVPYELAIALKELGFDEPCLAQYKKYDVGEATLDIGFSKNEIIMQFHKLSKFCSASLYQQAFRWFREKYHLRGFIGFRPNVKQFDCHIYDMSLSGKEYVQQRTAEEFNKDPKVGTYEEAELECLRKLIEIVKEKK